MIVPSCARQLASPTRSKFSRPRSPSISVTQFSWPGMCEHAATVASTSAAIQRFVRFIVVSPWVDIHQRPILRRPLRLSIPFGRALHALLERREHAAHDAHLLALESRAREQAPHALEEA